MITYGIGSALLVLGLLAMALQRLYSSVPVRELKRLASRRDTLAMRLYRVAAYGASLRGLLWIVVVLTIQGGFLLLMPTLPAPAAFLVSFIVTVLASIWLPSLALTQRSAQFASWFAPPLTWLLAHTHPFLVRIATFVTRQRALERHSRLYEKDDLVELLGLQKTQTDNRIAHADLDLAERALSFSERHAADIAQPRKAAHLVNADDTIGPLLLDQLHKSKQHSFLVYKGTKDDVIGTLAMHDAVSAKQGGRVLDLVRHDITFVHEDFTLHEVLEALRATGHQLAVVVNGFEEFVGVITMEQLMGELLGPTKTTDLRYDNRGAVAAFKPAQPEPAERAADPDQTEASPAGAQEAVSDAVTTTDTDAPDLQIAEESTMPDRAPADMEAIATSTKPPEETDDTHAYAPSPEATEVVQ